MLENHSQLSWMMSSNRKQLLIFGRSREVDNFWSKECISKKVEAAVRLTMVKLVWSSNGSSNDESFLLGILVWNDPVDRWICTEEFWFINPRLSGDVCARSCNPCVCCDSEKMGPWIWVWKWREFSGWWRHSGFVLYVLGYPSRGNRKGRLPSDYSVYVRATS